MAVKFLVQERTAYGFEFSELGRKILKMWISWQLPVFVACQFLTKGVAVVVCHSAHGCLGKTDGSDKYTIWATSVKHHAEKAAELPAFLHARGTQLVRINHLGRRRF